MRFMSRLLFQFEGVISAQIEAILTGNRLNPDGTKTRALIIKILDVRVD